MTNTKLRETKVTAGAKHKITYEWRSLLGIIGSWHEILKEQDGSSEINIITTSDDVKSVKIITPTKKYDLLLRNFGETNNNN